MEKDILEILENTSDDPFITSSKKLIKKLSKENSEEEMIKAKNEAKEINARMPAHIEDQKTKIKLCR